MPEENNLKSVLKELGESSSLHGIPKIISSRQVAVKVLWCLLLFGAVGLSSYQIYGLFDEFYSYPVKTSVTLDHASLPFPAITVCNSNPIRYSKLTLNDEMYEILLKKLDSDSGSENANPWKGIVSFFDDTQEAFVNVSDDTLEAFVNVSLLDDYADEPRVRDGFDVWRQRVLTVYRKLPRETREGMGHQADDMFHNMIFKGYQYFYDENTTTQFQSPIFGNCFTFDINEMSQSSGATKGLQMILIVEKEEYIEHFVSGYGMRLSIHQPGTYALPDKDSFVLNPGYETNIGLRMVRMSRLGGNYGTCIDGNSSYSVSTCSAECYRDHVINECSCIPYDSPETDEEEGTICDIDNEDDVACAELVTMEIDQGILSCKCPPKCNADTYSTTITGRKWPNTNYLQKVLMDQVCAKNISSMMTSCEQLKTDGSITKATYDDFVTNFLSINIYFEDLNFEIISEEPQYTTIRFLSDLGGAMGFYMGASVLTYVEIIHLILELCLYCKAKYGSKRFTSEIFPEKK